MLILALDTALEACSVALHDLEADRTLVRLQERMARGHAEALIPMVERALDEAEVAISDVDAFAVTVGPGSFTGLRVGISAARGFGLATGKPVIGIPTLTVLAAPLLAQDDRVPVAAAIDARHGNVYLQMIGAAGRVLVTPRATSVKDAARSIANGPVRLVGSGARLLTEVWPSGERLPVEIQIETMPDPVWLARLAGVADPARSEPRPLYLRDADAKPQTAQRIARR